MILELILVLQCSHLSWAHLKGEKCDHGICELVSNCPSALINIRNRIFPKICGFEGLNQEPHICCPDFQDHHKPPNNFDSEIKFTDIKHKIPTNKKKCREYALKACDGALMKSYDDDQSENYPFMALIGYGGERENIKWECGGSIISEYYILSAARCSYNSYGFPLWARLGKHDNSRIFEIKEFTVHPGYSSPFLDNDLMLLKLTEKIPFSYHMHPICLDDTEEHFDENKLIGMTSKSYVCPSFNCTSLPIHNEFEDKQTLISDLKYTEHSTCKQLFQTYQETERGYNEKTTMCLQYIKSHTEKCQGNFGDALFLKNTEDGCPSIYNLIGVLSLKGHRPHEYGCFFVSTSAIYTKISHHISWIADTVWKEHY